MNEDNFWESKTKMKAKIVHSKVKMSRKCTHPQAIQDVDEFVSSPIDWEKFSITPLTSSAVNGSRQNES